MSENSQIWLKPKPSHIDENFDDFIRYLKTNKDKSSELYRESIKLLKERVRILINERYELPVYRHLRDAETRKFNVRLCGAWLLAVDDCEYAERKLVLLTLINNLIQYGLITDKFAVNQESFFKKKIGDLVNMALSLISHHVPPTLRLSWSDLLQESMEIFLHSFLNNVFEVKEKALFEGRGTLIVSDGDIRIVPTSREQTEKSAFKMSYVLNDLLPKLRVGLYSAKDDQIKESKRNDVSTIENCVDSTGRLMEAYVRTPRRRFLKDYSDGDMVNIEIVGIGNKSFQAVSIDPDYNPIECKLVFENTLYVFGRDYPFQFWQRAINVGDKLTVKYNEGSKTFIITDDFIEYINDCVPCNEKLQARYYRDVSADKEFYEFITENGYIIFANITAAQADNLDESDTLLFEIFQHGEKAYRGCLYGTYCEAESVGLQKLEFNDDDALQSLVNDYVESIRYSPAPIAADEDVMLDKYFLKEICYTLNVMQSRESDPYDRYRILATLRLLSIMAQFDRELVYFDYLAKYIKILILFAETEHDENRLIQLIDAPEGLEYEETISHGSDILNILAQFAKDYTKDVNSVLTGYIDSDDSLLIKTASLVQAYNRLKNILDFKTLKGIKRQLLNDLSVVTLGDTNLELSSQLEGPYGTEDDMKEFKESFLEAPRDAKNQDQFYNIFRCIVGMMNNRGGVLYLGVNDKGFPTGLNRDLQNLARQNNVAPTLDQYMLHIGNMGERWFKNGAWRYVTMKPDLEHNILILSIEPCPYNIVELRDGKSYIRRNNTTRPLTDPEEIEEIRRRKQEGLRKTDDKVIIIQDAIQKERKVRLYNYQSSNSETRDHRVVEPFLIEDNEYVACFEDGQVKVFKISRMDRVALMKEGWTNKSKHKDPQLDVFHMTGDSKIKVRLRLKIRAKNAIVELYPKAASHITPLGNDTWMFEATINSLRPLVNFYLSYAESTEIVEAPGLLDSVRDYIKKNIPM